MTDQGRQFLSSNFKELLINLNIKHITTTPYNPTGNSIVERLNQEIGKKLRIGKGDKFVELIKKIQDTCNESYNRMIEQIPYEVMFQRKINNAEKSNIVITEECVNEAIKRKLIGENKTVEKNPLRVGDKVFIKNFNPLKLASPWKGPFEIIKIGGNENTFWIDWGNKETLENIKRLKLYKEGVDVVEQVLAS